MPYLWRLFAVLFIKAIAVIGLILYAGIGLGPDEAQYWTWSQALDWGYYSKPPAIAWQIWLGTKLFGNTELGVRFLSVVLSFLLSLSVYFLALACRLQPRTAFWAGVVMALSPLGMMGSFFAITDVGIVLFWTTCCIVMADALSNSRAPNYYLIGLLVLFGALFKWQAYIFWVLVIGSFPFYRYLMNKQVIGGIGISLLGLLPSLIWNVKHQWVTFRHVAGNITGTEAIKSSSFLNGNFWEFIGAQAMLLSPILFLLLIVAAVHIITHRKEIRPALLFCAFSGMLLIGLYSLAAIFKKLQGNWCDFAYPSLIVFLCWFLIEEVKWGTIWLKIGVAFSLALCLFGFSIPYIQTHSLFSDYRIPYKVNPFRHNLGWDKLKDALNQSGYKPDEHFLFGDKYQTSSILSFYGPEQKRAYFLNLHGIRKNQFSFWPQMADEQMGKTGFFVLPENTPHLEKNLNEQVAFYKGALSQYFKEVHFLGVTTLFKSYGETSKGVLIFKGVGYNGLKPIDPELY